MHIQGATGPYRIRQEQLEIHSVQVVTGPYWLEPSKTNIGSTSYESPNTNDIYFTQGHIDYYSSLDGSKVRY